MEDIGDLLADMRAAFNAAAEELGLEVSPKALRAADDAAAADATPREHELLDRIAQLEAQLLAQSTSREAAVAQ